MSGAVPADAGSAFIHADAEDIAGICCGNVVAIGNFDGVHRGHQAVLGHATSIAAERGVKAFALTFEPHPRSLFQPDKPIFRLTPRDAKRRLFEAIGLDGVIEMDFTRDLAAMDAADFVQTYLHDRFGAAHVVIGFDFHFGKGRRGSPAMLAEIGPDHGFDVTIEEAHGDEGGTAFSSSAIRDHLANGDMAAAADALGYHWFVSEIVIDGDKRGRTLGYPTANMKLPPETTLRHGVYAVLGQIDGRIVPGVANFGRRPQFDNGAPLLEPHFFDFSGNLYGKRIDLMLIDFLRPEARFDSVEALVAQMDRDSDVARRGLLTFQPTGIDRHLGFAA